MMGMLATVVTKDEEETAEPEKEAEEGRQYDCAVVLLGCCDSHCAMYVQKVNS
jgi:hypothetical protein